MTIQVNRVSARWALVAAAGCASLIQCSSSSDATSSSSAGAGGKADSAGAAGKGGSNSAGSSTLGGSSSGGAGAGGSIAGSGGSAAGAGGVAVGGAAGAGGGSGGAGGLPVTWGPTADYPYKLMGNFDEPYRGQFHFTAPTGWLNDANGMWFQDGLYHLAYQALPYTIDGGESDKFWGHATSPDLVHWTHWPLMLHPGLNAPGGAWSGSTVIDTNNTSGFKTGTEPVVVAIYTDLSIGTALAFSNDHGLTWEPYTGDLKMGMPGGYPRDPHVFWHEATKQWVLALYEDGITFYTAPDLKTWTKRTTIDFGAECPDLYQLPVDGDTKNMKWVLQDASGTYTLGQFDGTTFTLDHPDASAANKPDGSYLFHVDQSGDFYASQTFNRASFPDARAVQIAWIRGAGGTAPFNQALSFPAQLSVRTFPEGLRVARSPVDEVKALYTKTQHFSAQVAKSGVNPFAGISSTTFDWEVVLDVPNTTAKTIQMAFGDANFTYDVAGGTAFGATVSSIGNQVKLRVLRDWGEYEVYVNDGEVSFTKDFAFDPNNTAISLTSPDGSIGIVSSDLRTMGRAWPGTAAVSSEMIDDGDARVTYTGTWTAAPEGRYFDGSCRYATTSGAAFSASFSGTRVDWYGLKNVDLGFADVYLDGVLAQGSINCYDATRQNALLFTRGNLAPGAHTIKVVVNGSKDPKSAGIALVHDYIVAYRDQ